MSGRSFGKTKTQPEDPTRVPKAVDTSNFLYPIPGEVKNCVPLLHSLEAAKCSEVVRNILAYIQRAETSESDFIAFQKSPEMQNLSSDFSIIYSGIYKIIILALRNNVRLSKISSDLTAINCVASAIAIVCSEISSSRENLRTVVKSKRCAFRTVILDVSFVISKCMYN